MKKNISSLIGTVILAVITVTSVGCTACKAAGRATPAPAVVTVATQAPDPAPAPIVAQSPASVPTGVIIHAIKATPAGGFTNGMDRGAPCLFVNKSTADISVSAVANTTNKTRATFTLEIPRKTNRTFGILPGEYDYAWQVGDDPMSYPTTGAATLTVERRPVHLYDGAGNFHAVVIFR